MSNIIPYKSTGVKDASINERNIQEYIQNRYHCIIGKNPDQYCLDFMAYRSGTLCAAIEYKRRFFDKSTYDTTLMPLKKYLTAREYERVLPSIKCLYIVEFNDGVFFLDLLKEPDFIQHGGRLDRNLASDIQPMAHYYTYRLQPF